MKKQTTAEIQPQQHSSPLRLLPGSSLFDRIEGLSNSVARRAFEIFENRGRALGHDLDDWLRAESELFHPVHLEVAELDNAFKVRAEVPGFTAKELEVGLEPHRLTISGKRETDGEHATKKSFYSEHRMNQIFRTVDLPEEVDSSKVTATLKNGVLELTMPKTAKRQTVKIEEKPA